MGEQTPKLSEEDVRELTGFLDLLRDGILPCSSDRRTLADYTARLLTERREREAKLAELESQYAELEPAAIDQHAELAAIGEALGSVRFMDPPDGGSVTLAEQVQRMRETLTAAEAKLTKVTTIRERAFAGQVNWNVPSILNAIDEALADPPRSEGAD